MAEIDFPAGLPTPLQADYGFEHVDTVLRTPMASGRTRARQRFTSAPSRVNVQWLMRAPQAQLFEGFYRWDLKDGTKAFNTKLKTPLGLRIYQDVTFFGMYRGPVLVGGRFWRFTATLEIAHRPTISAEEAAFPNEILYSPLFDRNMNRDWPED